MDDISVPLRDFAARPICMRSPLAGDADDNVDQCVLGSRRAVTLRAIAISPDLNTHQIELPPVQCPKNLLPRPPTGRQGRSAGEMPQSPRQRENGAPTGPATR